MPRTSFPVTFPVNSADVAAGPVTLKLSAAPSTEPWISASCRSLLPEKVTDPSTCGPPTRKRPCQVFQVLLPWLI